MNFPGGLSLPLLNSALVLRAREDRQMETSLPPQKQTGLIGIFIMELRSTGAGDVMRDFRSLVGIILRRRRRRRLRRHRRRGLTGGAIDARLSDSLFDFRFLPARLLLGRYHLS